MAGNCATRYRSRSPALRGSSGRNTSRRTKPKILKETPGDYTNTVEGKLSDLAKELDMDEVTFVGFLDGINSSLKKEIKLDSLERLQGNLSAIDFEKLYYNMLDCKARSWLYTLKGVGTYPYPRAPQGDNP